MSSATLNIAVPQQVTLRRTTYEKSLLSSYRQTKRLYESAQYIDMPKTRRSTRHQTKKSYLKQQIFPFSHEKHKWYKYPFQQKPAVLQTNRKKYYYYMEIKRAEHSSHVYDTLVIARKRKCSTNNKDFGSLKLIKKEKISLSFEYIPKFVGFDTHDNNIDILINNNSIRTSHATNPIW